MRNVSSTSSGKQSVGGKDRRTKRGPWTPEEDQLLSSYINQHGEGQWRTLPYRSGLLRCGKSCRLRWMNYLRLSIKRGHIAPDEEDLILRLHRLLGNRWSLIAGRIPGRTDNEIKNYWNTHLSKKLISQGIDPTTHKPLKSSSSITQNPLYDAHHHNNDNIAAAAASRLPADPLYNSFNKIILTASVSPAPSVKNDQEYYYGGMDVDKSQFDLSTTEGKAKGVLSDDNEEYEDSFLSSLVNYEQLFSQQEQHESVDSCSRAFAFGDWIVPSSQPGFLKHEPCSSHEH